MDGPHGGHPCSLCTEIVTGRSLIFLIAKNADAGQPEQGRSSGICRADHVCDVDG
jgi:hypothetical protein